MGGTPALSSQGFVAVDSVAPSWQALRVLRAFVGSARVRRDHHRAAETPSPQRTAGRLPWAWQTTTDRQPATVGRPLRVSVSAVRSA